MRKFKINVPKGVNYLSDWKKFRLFHFPYILDKQLTGCGFTSWILSNNQNVILCSPRRALLESKLQAYIDELVDIEKNNLPELDYKLYYAKNEFEKSYGIDKDLNSEAKLQQVQELDLEAKTCDEKSKLHAEEFKRGVKDFVLSCQETPFSKTKYCKILVTYDSFRKVKEVLEELNLFDKFHIVVDEFSSIFTDSRFKSNTEMDLLKQLENVQNLCYVSATPMIESYLDKLEEFNKLPFVILDWSTLDPNRVITPKLEITPCTNINRKAKEIIEKYKNNTWKDSDNNTIRTLDSKTNRIEEVVSKEAVFYINSVKNICDIIKSNKLTQDECNIICAKTDGNAEKIRKAFKIKKSDFKGIGTVPSRRNMKNNKMFTFCTRTVYLGADFYSDNARSFIFSDANIETLAVDITLDLPQILGRQRLDENPWKNQANIYYKPLKDVNVKDWSVFQNILDRKKNSTDVLLKALDKLDNIEQFEISKKYEFVAKAANYADDYVAVNRHSGSTLVPKFNNLVMLSEIRAYEIQQIDYKDRFTVRSSINNQFNITEDIRVTEILKKYETYTVFEDKMEFLCRSIEELDLLEEIINIILSRVDDYVANYIRVMGIERIKAFSYRRYKLDKEMKKLLNNQDVDSNDLLYMIFSEFKEGDRITNKDVKNKLKTIYDKLGLSKTAKATDIKEWFKIKPAMVNVGSDKRVCGVDIVKKK